MPLNQDPLQLEPEPRSVQLARRWIADSFQALGREDLLECAELATSELVTNALLHAGDPIAVRLRGTKDHPRVDVSDGSRQLPLPPTRGQHQLSSLLATFGRGLDLVARCSIAWGATIELQGKTVWFEPADEPHEDLPPRANFLDEGEDTVSRPDGPMVTVRLRNVPVATLLGLRLHNRNLRRELRLISLAQEATYPLAAEITEVFRAYDANWPGALAEEANAAAADGRQVIDPDVSFPLPAIPVLTRMRELLARADEFCADERLLTIARSPHQRQFQDWLLGECERQGAGEPPRPWSGATPAVLAPEFLS